MKKSLFLTIALLCTIAQGLVLTACSANNDNPAIENSENQETVIANVRGLWHAFYDQENSVVGIGDYEYVVEAILLNDDGTGVWWKFLFDDAAEEVKPDYLYGGAYASSGQLEYTVAQDGTITATRTAENITDGQPVTFTLRYANGTLTKNDGTQTVTMSKAEDEELVGLLQNWEEGMFGYSEEEGDEQPYEEMMADFEFTIPMLELTNPEVGQVICSDGKNYNVADAPEGKDKVAMIAFLADNTKFAIALSDGQSNFGQIEMAYNQASVSCSMQTPFFMNGQWKLASIFELQEVFLGCGSTSEIRTSVDGSAFSHSFGNINAMLEAVGGNVLDGKYWTSTQYGSSKSSYSDSGSGYSFGFAPSNSTSEVWGYNVNRQMFFTYSSNEKNKVRAVLSLP